MPRVKSSPRKCIKSRTGQHKSYVVLAPDEVMKSSENATPDMVKLRHPRSGLPAMFLFSSDNSSVQEIVHYKDRKGSWFVNDTVQEDGKIHISTPMDPVFLVLPYLKKSKQEGKVMPLEDLLVDSEFPETLRLTKCSALKYINSIADRKGKEELNAWTYNEEKALRWLQKKSENIAASLKERGFNVGASTVSQTYVMTSNQKETDAAYLPYACGILCEYLPDDVAKALRAYLNIPEEEPRKRKPTLETTSSKRPKLEEEEEEEKLPAVEKNSAKKPTKSSSAKEKSQAKAASGSKSITSFFKKK